LKFLPLLKMQWKIKTRFLRYFGMEAWHDDMMGVHDSATASMTFQSYAPRPGFNGRYGFFSEVDRIATVFVDLDHKDIDSQKRSEGWESGPEKPDLHNLRVYLDTHPDIEVYLKDPDVPNLRVHFRSKPLDEIELEALENGFTV
jgi:hypothetical protein